MVIQSKLHSNYNKSNLFVVSSAVHSRFGVYSDEERFGQLKGTIESVCGRYDARVVLLDGGVSPLLLDERDWLESRSVEVVEFSEEPFIRQLQSLSNWDVVKNLAEVFMFREFFIKSVQRSFDFSLYSRVFKLSGRYRLNEDFNLSLHYNAPGRFVFKSQVPSQFASGLTRGIGYQYMCRLWSADWVLIPFLADLYQRIYHSMVQLIRSGGYADLEHLLYANIPSRLVCQVESVGVEGCIAPNGRLVVD